MDAKQEVDAINNELYKITAADDFKISSLVEKCVEKWGGVTCNLKHYDDKKRIRFVIECGGKDQIIKNLDDLSFLLKKRDYCNDYSSPYKKIMIKFVYWINKKMR